LTLRLYLDHHVPAVSEGLRLRGVDVLTAYEDGSAELEDPPLLHRTTELGRVLFTQDTDLLAVANLHKTTDLLPVGSRRCREARSIRKRENGVWVSFFSFHGGGRIGAREFVSLLQGKTLGHDQLFKALLEKFFRDFLELFFPPVAKRWGALVNQKLTRASPSSGLRRGARVDFFIWLFGALHG